jgi:hypothetical protein
MLRGAHRPLGAVLLRHRMAEQRHQSVAELLGNNLGLEVPYRCGSENRKYLSLRKRGWQG